MRLPRKPLLAVLVVPSCVVLVGACGDGSGDGDEMTGPNQPPTVTILQPASDTSVSQDGGTAFWAEATDPEDGSLAGDALVWESSEDGRLGTGVTISVSGLSPGEHTVTLTATDSEGATATDRVGATVVDIDPVETVLADSLTSGLVAHLTPSQRSTVEAALSECDDALARGAVPALRSCLEEARSEAGSASAPTDRAVGASLDLLLAHAVRQLDS